MSNPARVTVLCALPSEARPLVARWRLPLLCERPFRVYARDALRVVVSGIGGHACATAVGFAAGLARTREQDLWCNFGIAGHATLAPGTAIVADRVSQHGRDHAWYPSLLCDLPWPTAAVTSHDAPVTAHPPGTCADMEAAAFMAAATRVTAGDLVQVCKVVSDNVEADLRALDRARVSALMAARLAEFDGLVEGWRALARPIPAPDDEELDDLLGRWHFSHAQALQLRQLRARQRLLAPADPWPGLDPAACRDAGALLGALRARLDALPLHLGTAP